MVSAASVKYRAMLMGVRTGDMPDVSLIWSIQVRDGTRCCFGQGYGCQNTCCRFRQQCLALDFFADVTLPLDRSAGAVVATPTVVADRAPLEGDLFVGRDCASAGALRPIAKASSVS